MTSRLPDTERGVRRKVLTDQFEVTLITGCDTIVMCKRSRNDENIAPVSITLAFGEPGKYVSGDSRGSLIKVQYTTSLNEMFHFATLFHQLRRKATAFNAFAIETELRLENCDGSQHRK